MRSFTAGLLVWITLLGLWFFFIFQFSINELVLGAAISSVTLFALHRSLCAAPMAASPQSSWIAAVCSVPRATGEGLRTLFSAMGSFLLGKPSRSVWQPAPFEVVRDEDEKAGRRAFATLFSNIAPNSNVGGIGSDSGTMLVTALKNRPVPKMSREIESSGRWKR